jgi:hypothetical protein
MRRYASDRERFLRHLRTREQWIALYQQACGCSEQEATADFQKGLAEKRLFAREEVVDGQEVLLFGARGANVFYDILYSPSVAPSEQPAQEPQLQILEQRNTSTIKNEMDCKSWLIQLMADDSKPTKNRDGYQIEANNKFPSLGTRAFIRAWGNAIIETGNENWKKPGRKS